MVWMEAGWRSCKRLWHLARQGAKREWQRSKSGVMLMLCMMLLSLYPLAAVGFDALGVHYTTRMLLVQLASFLVPAALYWVVEQKKEAFSLCSVEKKQWPLILLCSVALAIFCVLFSSLFYLMTGTSDGLAESGVTGSRFMQTGLLASVVVPAVVEELLLRGPVFYSLRRGGTLGILLSGVTFAMLHGGLDNFVGPLVAGCGYAALTLYYGSVFPAMVCHLVYNGYIYLMSRMVMEHQQSSFMFFVFFANILVLFGCIYGIILIYGKRKNELSKRWKEQLSPPDYLYLKNNMRSVSFGVFFLLFLVRAVMVYI